MSVSHIYVFMNKNREEGLVNAVGVRLQEE